MDPRAYIFRALGAAGRDGDAAVPGPARRPSPAGYPSGKVRASAAGPSRRFTYHPADDSISCSGRHLTRLVPARILRRLVRDLVAQGRHEVEFRGFKRDPEIVGKRRRPDFEER